MTPARRGARCSVRAPAVGLLLVVRPGAGRSAGRTLGAAGAALRPRPAPARPDRAPRRPTSPASAAAGVFGPVLRAAADAVERVLGGAASVRRRLERAGLDDDRARLPGRAGALGAGRRSRVAAAYCLLRGARARRGGTVAAAAAVRWSRSSPACCARDNRLTAQVKQRERRVLAEFPTVAELLALAVAAGESPVAALDRVVRRTRRRALRRPRARARRGPHRQPVAAAFDRLAATHRAARRWPASPQGIAVAVERGTPLADVLHAQAADVREAGAAR